MRANHTPLIFTSGGPSATRLHLTPLFGWNGLFFSWSLYHHTSKSDITGWLSKSDRYKQMQQQQQIAFSLVQLEIVHIKSSFYHIFPHDNKQPNKYQLYFSFAICKGCFHIAILSHSSCCCSSNMCTVGVHAMATNHYAANPSTMSLFWLHMTLMRTDPILHPRRSSQLPNNLMMAYAG